MFEPARHRVTPEDAEILRRRLIRILAGCPTGSARASEITIRTLKHACGDYLEPRPHDGALTIPESLK